MWETEQYCFFTTMEVNGAQKQPSSEYLPLCSAEQTQVFNYLRMSK